MDVPIASYYEVLHNSRRRFTLYSDRIFVKVRSPRVNIESTIWLADLRPEPNKLWVRTRFFFLGVFLMIASMISAFYAVANWNLEEAIEGRPLIGFSMAGAFLITAVPILLMTYRKCLYIQFVSHGGIPLLDVAHAGPERKKHGRFIEALIEQTRLSKLSG